MPTPSSTSPRSVATCQARSTPRDLSGRSESPEVRAAEHNEDRRIEELLAAQAQLDQQAQQLEHLEGELIRREQIHAQLAEVLGAGAQEDLVERARLVVAKLAGARQGLRIADARLQRAMECREAGDVLSADDVEFDARQAVRLALAGSAL